MKHERETIINMNEEDPMASIFTYSTPWQKHLEERMGLKAFMDNGSGGKEYLVSKKLIKPPRAPKKLSAEQRDALRSRLEASRKSAKQPRIG